MKLSTTELAEVAKEFDIDPKLLVALATVESAGSGFVTDDKGAKHLTILFERHKMWRRLKTRGIDPKILQSAKPRLCSVITGGYGPSGMHQWGKISEILDWAKKNAPDQFESYKKSAYESCSWGAFQLMGENYEDAGFENVYQLKHELEKGHKEQMAVICTWLRATGILELLKNKRWAAFARRYNGAHFKKNEYDTKLEAAFDAL